jgi:hypothetical protein
MRTPLLAANRRAGVRREGVEWLVDAERRAWAGSFMHMHLIYGGTVGTGQWRHLGASRGGRAAAKVSSDRQGRAATGWRLAHSSNPVYRGGEAPRGPDRRRLCSLSGSSAAVPSEPGAGVVARHQKAERGSAWATTVDDGQHRLTRHSEGGNRAGDQGRLKQGRHAARFGGEGRLTGGAW